MAIHVSCGRLKSKAFILVLISVLSLSGCIPLRAVFLGAPDHHDIHRFNSNPIKAGDDCFQFIKSKNTPTIKVNEWGSGLPFFVDLNGLNTLHKVRSMLVIRNDSLLYEFYGRGCDANAIHPSYSIAKSFTSALIGIAIDEHFIPSVRSKVVDFIPELKGLEWADELLVEHLLNQTSGIEYSLQSDAVLYYGNDLKRALKLIRFAHHPGTTQHYLNINIQLLGIILHRSTGMPPSEYLSQKLWKPMAACNDARWTTDKKGEDLAFCCLGASALDYAKFGRLYLNRGNWNGKQLVPSEWVDRSLARDTTEGSSFGYNYCWHIGEKEYGDFMADGMYKQHIYVNPQKNILIVLMCERENALKAERVQWRNVFKQISDQL